MDMHNLTMYSFLIKVNRKFDILAKISYNSKTIHRSSLQKAPGQYSVGVKDGNVEPKLFYKHSINL